MTSRALGLLRLGVFRTLGALSIDTFGTLSISTIGGIGNVIGIDDICRVGHITDYVRLRGLLIWAHCLFFNTHNGTILQSSPVYYLERLKIRVYR